MKQNVSAIHPVELITVTIMRQTAAQNDGQYISVKFSLVSCSLCTYEDLGKGTQSILL